MGAFDSLQVESVQVHIDGEPWKRWPAPRTVGAQPGARMKRIPERDLTRAEPLGLYTETTYHDAVTGLRAIAHRQQVTKSPIARHWVSVFNDGPQPLALDVLHAAFLGNIAWDAPDTLRLHVAYNQNYAEAQWRAAPLAAFGLVKTVKSNVGNILFNSIGRSAQQFVPMGMLEDTRCNQTLIWQLEHSGSWMWDLGQGAAGELNLALGGLTETYGHWRKVLKPGQSVQTFPVSYGVVAGDADEALTAMADYRRRACRQPHAADDACPVIFNDYMNCLEGNPTTAASLPLIRRAAEAGCEIYCIDAGWYGTGGWDMGIGDWHENPARFPNGLAELIAAIEQAGMRPGLWVEIEAVSTWSEAAKLPEAWFLRRHGKRITFSDRYLLDFRNPDVRAFADATLDRLIQVYRLGYVKFDYNCSPLLGPDHESDSPGDGLLNHIRAVHDWYRALRTRHPDVILESCASGGMRNEYGMLSILQLASLSDQPDYRLNPAIVSGSLATVLPEQLGIWSYPLKDSGHEATVFNMINAMLGRIHQSGPISDLPLETFAIVREGLAFYKNRLRHDIPQAYPVWPLGHLGMERTNAFQCVGLHVPAANRLWLAVWRLDSDADSLTLPLTPWLPDTCRVEQVFPVTPPCLPQPATGTVTVKLPERYTARLFLVQPA